MLRSVNLAHALIGAVMAIVLALAACVQLASDALYAQAAPGSLAARVPLRFGLAVYGALDKIAPAEYVEDALAHEALARGALDEAQTHAVRMPPGGRRDDLLSQIAAAHGQSQLAFEYAFVADDVDVVQTSIVALARHDVRAAIALEVRERVRLSALGTHPDSVAESYYVSGTLYDRIDVHDVAYRNYLAALAIAPLNMKYLLSSANDALALHDDAAAKRLFRNGLDVDPANGDALCGLGLVALRAGHRAQAAAYLARARAVDAQAAMIATLAEKLR